MIINTAAVEMVLLNKAIPANFLENQTGVSKATISRFRNPEKPRGIKTINNIPIGTAVAIQKWIDDGNFIFKWGEYLNLLPEFKADVAEGLFKDGKAWIVRGDLVEEMQYFPIIDWYYTLDEATAEGATVEALDVNRVIREMEVYSQF